jgi:hypothetical protein
MDNIPEFIQGQSLLYVNGCPETYLAIRFSVATKNGYGTSTSPRGTVQDRMLR